MVNEPQTVSAVDFLNHIQATLNRCSGGWQWDAPFPCFDDGVGLARVRFVNTGRVYHIEYNNGIWQAFENGDVCGRITGLLQGKKRDEAGVLR